MTTLKQIAECTGLSVSVVSRALNARPDKNARVAPATRKRILKAARRLNFRRNRAAEFMQRGKSATIGVLLPDIPNRLVGDLVFGVAEVLAKENFPLQMDFNMYASGFRRFIRNTIDLAHSGIISYATLISDPEIKRAVQAYQRKGGKVVLLNTILRLKGVTLIAIDNRKGGRLAAERLLFRKCARFAVVDDYFGRREGFETALAEAGKKSVFIEDDPRGMNRLIEFCRGATASEPAGIFASCDELALRIMRLLAGTRWRVGQEILLIGYDDLDLTAEVTPALTTIHQPFREEGRIAARRVLGMIYGEPASEVLIEPRLVVRESA